MADGLIAAGMFLAWIFVALIVGALIALFANAEKLDEKKKGDKDDV